MRVKDIPQIEKLSVPEKILLVEDLWDDISSEESAVPVPESHMAELDKRLTRHKSRPGELPSLDELQKRIESRKRRDLGQVLKYKYVALRGAFANVQRGLDSRNGIQSFNK